MIYRKRSTRQLGPEMSDVLSSKTLHPWSPFITALTYLGIGIRLLNPAIFELVMSALLSIENSVLPSHYNITLEIDPEKSNYKGSVGISLIPNTFSRSSFEEFRLHSKDLVVLSAFISDETGSDDTRHALNVAYDSDSEVAIFSSETPIELSADRQLLLDIGYIGRIRTIKTYQDETVGIFKTNFMDPKTGKANSFAIATHCQPYYARTIFPCIDEPCLKATYQLAIKTLSRFKVISNTGKSSFEQIPNSSEAISKFHATPPMTSSLFGFVIGDLQVINTEVISPVSGRKQPLAVYAPSDVKNATFTLDTVQKYLPLLEKYFGKAYALDKLDFVLLPFLKDMAMENFGMITVQMNHLLLEPSDLASRQMRDQVEQLVVHELVHQWMGNFISFDSFEYLWFNECFATWCACDILEKNGDLPGYWTSKEYLVDQVATSMTEDTSYHTLSITAASLKAMLSSPSQTKDLFDLHSYLKGISLLRGMYLCIGENHFQTALQKVFQDESFYKNSVKPIDIIFHMANTLKSENVSNYFSSWCRTAGLALVSVELMKEGEKLTTKLTQHRFLTSGETDYEDVPYHIPLLIQLPSAELDATQILMTDRTLNVNYPILLCNHDAQGYYFVSYESESCYEQFKESLSSGILSGTDLTKIFNDISHYIGNPIYQKPIHFRGLHKLLQHLSSGNVNLDLYPQYWQGIKTGLQILMDVYMSNILCQRPKGKTSDYVNSIILPFIALIKWPTGKFEEGSFSLDELESMSIIMFLGRSSDRVIELSQKYFNHLLQGPSRTIPIEIVNGIFAVFSQNAKNTKQWKRLLMVAENTSDIQKNITFVNTISSGNQATLKLYALRNLCFSRNSEIIKRSLQYVTSNLDVDGIGSVLNGITYNAHENPTGDRAAEKICDIVWEWYTDHFDEWARASVKKDPSSSIVKSSLISISRSIFQMFADEHAKVNKFLDSKRDPYGRTLNISSDWEVIKDNYKRAIIMAEESNRAQ